MRAIFLMAAAIAIGGCASTPERERKPVSSALVMPVDREPGVYLRCAEYVYGSGDEMSIKPTVSGNCLDRIAFEREPRWPQGFAKPFRARLLDHLAARGVVARELPPVAGGSIRRDKHALTPYYPSGNSEDVLLDFALLTVGYAPIRTVEGGRRYAPYAIARMRIVDGRTGKAVAQRDLVYGPPYLRTAGAAWRNPPLELSYDSVEAIIADPAGAAARVQAGASWLADAAVDSLGQHAQLPR